MRINLQRRAGFTLVEIVIVVMIIGIIMAWGLPTFVQTFKREPIVQAAHDIMEACSSARAAAILTGNPAEMEFVANSDGQSLTVKGGGFSADIPLVTINPELIRINFKDVKNEEGLEPKVKFFPNGTSDEFSIVLLDRASGKRRMISLNVLTGMATLMTEEGIARLK